MLLWISARIRTAKKLLSDYTQTPSLRLSSRFDPSFPSAYPDRLPKRHHSIFLTLKMTDGNEYADHKMVDFIVEHG